MPARGPLNFLAPLKLRILGWLRVKTPAMLIARRADQERGAIGADCILRQRIRAGAFLAFGKRIHSGRESPQTQAWKILKFDLHPAHESHVGQHRQFNVLGGVGGAAEWPRFKVVRPVVPALDESHVDD